MLRSLKQIININARNREKWLEEKLKQLPAGSKILDAGAGELQYKKFCSHLDYTSQDFGQYDGQGDKQGMQMATWDNSKLDIVSDISAIPRPDASFDAIMCIEVFEHIPEPIKALSEFSRLLKSGGQLILTAPFCSLTHFAPYFFYTGYSRYWHQKLLADNGFEIISIARNGNYFSYLMQEMFRVPKMILKYTDLNPYVRYALVILIMLPIGLMAALFYLLSLLSDKSRDVLCFGLQVVAVKK